MSLIFFFHLNWEFHSPVNMVKVMSRLSDFVCVEVL